MIFLFFIKNIFYASISVLITVFLLYIIRIFNFSSFYIFENSNFIYYDKITNFFILFILYIVIFLLLSYTSLLINSKILLLIYILTISFLLAYIYLLILNKIYLNLSNVISVMCVFIFDLYFLIYSIKYSK